MPGPSTYPLRLYLGKPGSGKTYAAQRYVERARRAGDPFVIAHDVKRQWEGLADVCLDTQQWELIGYREAPVGTIWVVDEADLVLHHAAKRGSTARDLLRRGRDRRYRLVIITQRPQLVMPEVRNFATRVQAFRQQTELETTWLVKNFGFDTARLMALPKFRCLVWKDTD